MKTMMLTLLERYVFGLSYKEGERMVETGTMAKNVGKEVKANLLERGSREESRGIDA